MSTIHDEPRPTRVCPAWARLPPAVWAPAAALAVALIGAVPSGHCAIPAAGPNFEADRATIPGNAIDALVEARLRQRGIAPANLCSDPVFIRRVFLDVLGTLPRPVEVREFLQDRSPGKRAALIDRLLTRPEFADYWTLKWCDVLRVKSEFPMNLWPNAVQAYHRWVHDAIRENWPYDRFARELLTASGSNFRVPQVNFYRAIQGRTPAAIAQAVALTFMGMRLAHRPEAERSHLAAFFSRVAYKSTGEWKEEIVLNDPAPAPALNAILPDGRPVTIAPGKDPRQVFADWLTAPGNPWLGPAVVNRIWAWLLGRGLVNEPDDFRPDNPPVHPDVLALLTSKLEGEHGDLRGIYRLILNSRTYQQSSIPRCKLPEAESLFAFYPVRQLDAEVLIDSICYITGVGENYWSAIPEPYTYIPDIQPTITLADGSITSPFLEMFGRPARDSGLMSERINQPSEAQRLHLLNSAHIQRKIAGSQRLRALFRAGSRNPESLIQLIYLGVLSRLPTEAELDALDKHWHRSDGNLQQVGQDLVWALFNSKEFLYRH